jgi:hypothetical protein
MLVRNLYLFRIPGELAMPLFAVFYLKPRIVERQDTWCLQVKILGHSIFIKILSLPVPPTTTFMEKCLEFSSDVP